MTDKRRVPCHIGVAPQAHGGKTHARLVQAWATGQIRSGFASGTLMTDRGKPKSASGTPRADRLGAALRENLKRRKAQAKGRADQADGAGPAQPATPKAPNSAGISKDKPGGNT
jgi:hypothetical protein